jgi:predicted Zn-dependent protease
VKNTVLTHIFIGVSAFLFVANASTQTPVKPTPSPQSIRSLPRLGEAGALDIHQERRLGDRIAQQIYRDPDLFDDPVLLDYVHSLWKPLQAAARARGEIAPDLAERFAWEIFLSRERTVNAFALPGGYFGLHLGLLAQAGGPDELASVLAHELSHVSQRHISRLIAKQDQQSLWVMGAMILGALAASAAKNADIAQAAIVGSQAVAAQTQLNFSRDMEREADRVGYTVLTQAGFDGQGFVRMFDRLLQVSRHNDDGSFPYLRSHPLTSERMADMKARLGVGGQVAKEPMSSTLSLSVNFSLQHALMSARARVWSEPDAMRWREWLLQAQRLPAPAASASGMEAMAVLQTRYAAAVAAWRLQDFGAAWRMALSLWQQVTPQVQNDRFAVVIRALLLEFASHPAAWGQMPPLLKASFLAKIAQPSLQADDRASVLWAAQVLMLHQPEQVGLVTERLRWWVTEHARDAAAWALLAKAWALDQQPLKALRAEAESRAAQFDWAGAVDRLRSAQDWMRQHPSADLIEQSIIDARYRELQQRLQEDLREQREAR